MKRDVGEGYREEITEVEVAFRIIPHAPDKGWSLRDDLDESRLTFNFD